MNDHDYILSNLNMISRLALLEGAKDTRKSIDSLVKILRYMDFEHEAMSTLTKELNIISKMFYLFQQKKRHGFNGIIVNKDVLDTFYIEKGKVLELVQVALNKRIQEGESQLEIKVITKVRENVAEVIIQDNGNVDQNVENECLAGLYKKLIRDKDKDYITVESKNGIGTKVIIRIPID